MATTSGTVSEYPYNNRKILDRAFGTAGYVPQKVTPEAIAIATDMLMTMTAEWINSGFPLWTRQYLLCGITPGSAEIVLPAGTVDVFETFWRILMPYRGDCTLAPSTANSTLFGGEPNDDVVIPGANPSVTVAFDSDTVLNTIGVLLGNVTAITAALQVQTSEDGSTYTTVQTLPSTTFNPLAWSYFDLDPAITTQYVRLRYVTGGSWTLNQLNFGLANGQDIQMGTLNMDDYYNLSNRQFQGNQPNSVFIDRQVDVPVPNVWPVPSIEAFYNGTVTALVRRYIQDPGSMTNVLEVPQRWFEAVQYRLGQKIIDGIPHEQITGESENLTYLKMQERDARRTRIDTLAAKAELLAWSEERNRSPLRLTPSIAPYTR